MVERDRGLQEAPAAAQTLTIDIETVPVQGVGVQQGDALGQLTQLLVQLAYVQRRAHGVRTVGADGVHSGCCPILLGPRVAGLGKQDVQDMTYIICSALSFESTLSPSFMVFLFIGS